ncbi:hypothetical protein C8Q76DRAFT_816437 [Earliella scabrosa]|nr:hypothetical protein C8Q76DRAFT_816437 [Earliella scabrosa]
MNATVSWHEEPKFRGTFSILTSCLSTLFISTWSALHLDIPDSEQSGFMRFLDKIGWLFIGLLAPEYLLLLAFNQYLAARALTKFAQKKLESRPSGSAPWFDSQASVDCAESESVHLERALPLKKRKYPWTLTHSYFAIMGGFVLQDPHDPPVDRYLPAWQGNGVLTEPSVRFLMDKYPEFIPDIHVDELLDRGKADGLAKMLLTWQVLWFCLSCLNRDVQHLPLSLLEVTTIAHALCALLTYAAWWKKPKDIGQPIVIGTQSSVDRQLLRGVGAWLSTLSYADRSFLVDGFDLSHESEYDCNHSYPVDGWSIWVHERGQEVHPCRHISSHHPPSPEVIRRSYLSVSAMRRHLTALNIKYIFYWRPLPWYVEGSSIDEAEEQAANERMSLLSSLSKNQVHEVTHSPYCTDRDPLVVPVAYIQVSTHSAETAKSRSGIGLALLPAVYGFPHLIGLDATFPTAVERLLWRWTTVAIMVLGVGTFCIVYMVHKLGQWWYFTHYDDRFGRFLMRLGEIIAFFNVLVYFVGSMYLVAESFRQLFALPPESFTLPSWGNYWPHFS